MNISAPLLGQLLLKAKLITEDQLVEALNMQKLQGMRLGSALVKLGYLTEDTLLEFLSKQYNAPAINLSQHKIDVSLLKLIPYEIAKRYQVLPISKDGPALRIAIADPSNNFAIDDIKFLTSMKVAVHVAAESSIVNAIERFYAKPQPQVSEQASSGSRDKSTKEFFEVDELHKIIGNALEEMPLVEEGAGKDFLLREMDAPVVKLVNGILMNALNQGASDIHIEPADQMVRIRYRIDGVLYEALTLPPKLKNAITSRIKILAHLDISERRLPQDGRIKLKFADSREIDFRVSTFPGLWGEKVVLRILDKSNLQLDLTKLGFEKRALHDFTEALKKPYGLILVTGPTGSGKTTTLYSALQVLNKPNVNIMTAEDPIEYNFFGINQGQIKEDIGLTFATCLRSFLRQDPDIIMVGEIRDFETAEIAVKAALTGHLVLSTIHTNDAPSTITRLINMGIEPFLVASSVVCIVAQRLARKICTKCKTEQQISADALEKIGFPKQVISKVKCYAGTGCPACNQTGYKGRIALHEVMPLQDKIKELILQGAPTTVIKHEAARLGMLILRQTAIRKVAAGIITIEELLRVTADN